MTNYDENLPVFVYGVLKPGEFSHVLINDLIDEGSTRTAKLQNYSLTLVHEAVRVSPKNGSEVNGSIVYPQANQVDRFREVIERLEQVPKLYDWHQGKVTAIESDGSSHEVNVNFLTQLDMSKSQLRTNAQPLDDEYSWNSSMDLVLCYGIPKSLQALTHIRETLGDLTGKSAPEFDLGEVEKFLALVELQTNYMLLWAIVERCASLFNYRGPQARQQIPTLTQWLLNLDGKNEFDLVPPALQTEWKGALTSVKNTIGLDSDTRVYDKNFPIGCVCGFKEREKKPCWDCGPFHTRDSGYLRTWYAMRNNITHKGKSAIRDASKVQQVSQDLHNCLAIFLSSHSEPIRQRWLEINKANPNFLFDWRG